MKYSYRMLISFSTCTTVAIRRRLEDLPPGSISRVWKWHRHRREVKRYSCSPKLCRRHAACLRPLSRRSMAHAYHHLSAWSRGATPISPSQNMACASAAYTPTPCRDAAGTCRGTRRGGTRGGNGGGGPGAVGGMLPTGACAEAAQEAGESSASSGAAGAGAGVGTTCCCAAEVVAAR